MHQVLPAFRDLAGVSASALARRAGVHRATLSRIERGEVSPSLATISEIAAAAGYDLRLELAPLSDPDAMRAARIMLAGEPALPELENWIQRLQRWTDEDPVAVAAAAGRAADLWERDGRILVTGPVDELKLAGAGSASRDDWLLSGPSVLRRMEETGDTDPGGPLVIHAADPRRVSRLLEHVSRTEQREGASAIIVPMAHGVDTDAWTDGRIRLAAPIQGLLDGFALGGAAAAAAETIARRW